MLCEKRWPNLKYSFGYDENFVIADGLKPLSERPGEDLKHLSKNFMNF